MPAHGSRELQDGPTTALRGCVRKKQAAPKTQTTQDSMKTQERLKHGRVRAGHLLQACSAGALTA